MVGDAVSLPEAECAPLADRPPGSVRLVVCVRHAAVLEALVAYLEEHGADTRGTTRPEDVPGMLAAHRPQACLVEDHEGLRLSELTTSMQESCPEVKVVLLAAGPRVPATAGPATDAAGVVPQDCSLQGLVETLAVVLDGQQAKVVALPRQRDRRRTAPAPGRSVPGSIPLSKREEEVFLLLRLGGSNAQISEKLEISVNTVRTHIHNLLQKLGVRTREQAALLAASYEDEYGSAER